MLRMRPLPAGFIAPRLPTKTDKLPSGGLWLHEIKHDGFRIIARKDGERMRLYSRPGNDFNPPLPADVETLARLRSHSCIDGEAVASAWLLGWRLHQYRGDWTQLLAMGSRPWQGVCLLLIDRYRLS
jgi:bifunctional non-homologous end joining protein LigD